jgi:hypothetical protein
LLFFKVTLIDLLHNSPLLARKDIGPIESGTCLV